MHSVYVRRGFAASVRRANFVRWVGVTKPGARSLMTPCTVEYIDARPSLLMLQQKEISDAEDFLSYVLDTILT